MRERVGGGAGLSFLFHCLNVFYSARDEDVCRALACTGTVSSPNSASGWRPSSDALAVIPTAS